MGRLELKLSSEAMGFGISFQFKSICLHLFVDFTNQSHSILNNGDAGARLAAFSEFLLPWWGEGCAHRTRSSAAQLQLLLA